MMITVEDRRAVSAEVTVEMVESYLRRSGWEANGSLADEPKRCVSFTHAEAELQLFHTKRPLTISYTIEAIAHHEKRQPSEVLSDIVGYQVGLDRGRASVLRNSASARVVEAREALAKVRPSDAVGRERTRVRLAQAEAELAAATRALEAAKAAEART